MNIAPFYLFNRLKKIIVYLVLLLVTSMSYSCGPKYALKEDAIQHQIDYCQEFADKMGQNDMFYYHCFDFSYLTAYSNLHRTCVKCAKKIGRELDWGKIIQDNSYVTRLGGNLDRSTIIPGKSYVTDKEFDIYLQKGTYCTVSRYIEQYIDSFCMDKLLDEKCRFMLLLYVVSNNEYIGNEEIFEKYLDGKIKYIHNEYPERFYCFSRSIDELEQDIIDIELDAIERIRDYYYELLPEKADRKFIKRYDKAFSGSAKYYLEKNKEFFSTKGLNSSQQKVCEEKIKPLIQKHFPDFNL